MNQSADHSSNNFERRTQALLDLQREAWLSGDAQKLQTANDFLKYENALLFERGVKLETLPTVDADQAEDTRSLREQLQTAFDADDLDAIEELNRRLAEEDTDNPD